MRTAIWKLSALATVVGLGLVAVVMQQRGLGLSPGQASGKSGAAASSAPQPQILKGGTPTAAAAKVTQAESTQSPAADPNEPPDQLQSFDGGTESPTLAENTASGDEGSESQTQPRIKPRTHFLKDKLDNDDPSVTEEIPVEEFAEASPRGRGNRNSRGPEETDPTAMEGAGLEPPENALTDEADPFAKRREATSRRGATPSRIDADRSNAESIPGGEEMPAESVNPFEGDSQVATTPRTGPVVPVPGTPRGNPRSRFVSDDAGAEAASGNSGAVLDTNDQLFDEPGASPAGYRQAAAPAGPQGKAPAKPRPVIGDEESFKSGAAPMPPSEPPPAVPPAKSGAGTANKRPVFVPEEDTMGPRSPAEKNNGPVQIEKIPKIDRDAGGAESSMPPAPPPAARSGRQRPNPFAEEGDGPGGLGVRPNSTGTQGDNPRNNNTAPQGPSAPTDDPNSDFPKDHLGRPSKHIMEIETDDQTPLTSTPEAAASRSPGTEVIDRPARSSSGNSLPPVGNNYGGRGKVTIEKTAPATAYVGQPLVYKIVVRNTGNGLAQQVVVEDLLPDGVTIVGSIPQGEMTGRRLSWRVGVLSPGEERLISVKVIPGAAGAIGSAATVKFVADQMYASADGVDPAGLSTTTVPRTTPRTTAPRTIPRTATGSRTAATSNGGVQLEMLAPQQVAIGQSFDVRFRVTNRTGQPFNDIRVRSTLPDGLLHESHYQDLYCPVGALNAGETREVTLTVTATRPGRATSRVMAMLGGDQIVQSDEFSLEVTGGNVSTASLSGGVPGAAASRLPTLAVDVIPPSGPTQVGSRVTYEIRLINRGTVPVRQAAAKLEIPPELQLVDAGPVRFRQEGTNLVFDAIPILDAGQQTILRAEFIAQAAGDAYLKVQFVGAHMKRPLTRDELLVIGNQ